MSIADTIFACSFPEICDAYSSRLADAGHFNEVALEIVTRS